MNNHHVVGRWIFALGIAVGISLSVCYLFLRNLCGVAVQKRLIVRQMMNLVVADFLFILSGIYVVMVVVTGAGPNSEEHHRKVPDWAFWIGVGVGLSACAVSALIELHISLGVVFAIFGRFEFVRWLAKLRVFISLWILGIGIVVLDLIFIRFGHSQTFDLLSSILLLVCVVASFVAYLAAFIQALRLSGERVQKKIWSLAWTYPISFFFTTGPFVMVELMTDAHANSDFSQGFLLWWYAQVASDKACDFPWYIWISAILLVLNGPVNACTIRSQVPPASSAQRNDAYEKGVIACNRMTRFARQPSIVPITPILRTSRRTLTIESHIEDVEHFSFYSDAPEEMEEARLRREESEQAEELARRRADVAAKDAMTNVEVAYL